MTREGNGAGKVGQGPASWLRLPLVALLAVLFLAIVALGLVQIGLRNLFDEALPWADPAMRAGVLWIAMLAAVLAADEARHIRIDLVGRFVPPAWAGVIERVVFALTALVCGAMTFASLRIVRLEYDFGETAFLVVPRWVVMLIIPVGFALMTARFLVHALFPPERPVQVR